MVLVIQHDDGPLQVPAAGRLQLDDGRGGRGAAVHGLMVLMGVGCGTHDDVMAEGGVRGGDEG